jgi:glucose/arabinose dehydrogenase
VLPANRRRFLRASAAAFAGSVAGCGGRSPGAETGPSTAGGAVTTAPGDRSPLDGTGVGLARVASGFASPVDFFAPAGTGRRFVVDQPGLVWEVTDGGRAETPYLDLRDRVVDVSGYSERGLLGVAPHPNFAGNGRLYVRYSAPRRAGTPPRYSHTFVLSELTVDPDPDPDPDADAEAGETIVDAERTLLEIPEPQPNHNAGSVVFGPDGYLYVGVGDGGGAGDVGTGHVEDWYDGVGGGNGQDVTANLLGSVLRIAVDDRTGDRPYGVPDDNPLVGRPGLDEQYAWGFRNPWRMSFDGEDLYVADVGESAYEEVNLVERGGNYGWNVREGAHCFEADSCPTSTPDGASVSTSNGGSSDSSDGDPLIDPVIEYPHSGAGATGIAVIGGHVHRGDDLPALSGAYVFADWRTEGRLFAARPDEKRKPWPIAELPIVRPRSFDANVLSFGRDETGESYVLASGGGADGSGALFRLVEP